MKSGLIAAAVISLTGGAAEPQARTAASWVTPPDADLASALFPAFARFLEVRGTVKVGCWVAEDGHPFHCKVIRETPQGLGFGAAARLVIASGQIRAARVDGDIEPGSIQTNVRFMLRDPSPLFGGWTGPEPSAARLALARRYAERRESTLSNRDRFLEGLDVDRQTVVSGWLDELLPMTDERLIAALTLQLARLHDEAELQMLLDGEDVAPPPDDLIRAAWPDATPEENIALQEVRRRYCERYVCDAAAGAEGQAGP